MPADGVKFLGAYIKLRKFLRKSKRREKKNRHLTPDFKALQEAVRKILDAGMLKFQPSFREIRGKARKSERKSLWTK